MAKKESAKDQELSAGPPRVYPDAAATLAATQALIQSARDGSIFSDIKGTTYNGYILTGSILSVYPGSPDDLFTSSNPDGESSLSQVTEEQKGELRAALVQAGVSEDGTMPPQSFAAAGPGTAAVDPTIVNLIMQIIMWWLNRKSG